jgi:LysM repeat protein
MISRMLFIGAVAILLAGCQATTTAPTGLPSPIPWETPTTTPTPNIPTPAVSDTPTFAPTPTTQMYKVKSGETFISIASHFGITVDALRAANPKVQERFLSIGQALVIPTRAGTPLPAQPTATPVPLALGPARCFTELSGGKWCLAMVSNPGPDAVEGIRVRFALYASKAENPVAELESVVAPDSLPAGERAPAAVYFPPADAAGNTIRAELIGAVDSGAKDPTVPLSILSRDLKTLNGGLEITFAVRISPASSAAARRIEAVATLYDSSGQPVGFRRMESVGEWKAGDTAQFVLRVYSLGADTEQYELVARAYADAPQVVTPTPTSGS